MLSWKHGLMLVLSLSLILSCEKRKAAVIESDASTTIPAASAMEDVFVSFLTGDVRAVSGADERRLSIGDTVSNGDHVLTGVDGYAEIQLGTLGVIRIQAETEYTVESVDLGADAARTSGFLKSGSVMAKVRKLTSNDAFEINVPGAVCAVRGTKFLVRAGEQSITIAVSQGAVAVSPPSLTEIGSESDPSLLPLQVLMPLVGVDEEFTFATDALEGIEAEVREWKALGESGIDDSFREKVSDALGDLSNPMPISTENSMELQSFEAVSLSDSRPMDSGDEDSSPEESIVSLTVRTEPDDAQIIMNGQAAGLGRASRAFVEGTTVSVAAISADGVRIEKDVVAGAEDVVTLVFEESVPEAVDVEASLSVVEEPVVFSVDAFPADAVISIDDAVVGVGHAELELDASSMVTVEVERAGYIPAIHRAQVSSTPMRVELEPRLVTAQIPLPDGPAVGRPVVAGALVVMASRNGTLFAVNAQGETLWTRETANRDGENTAPVVNGNRVYTIGSAELTILDARSGEVIARRELTGDRVDLFGRRPLPLGGRLVLPADSSLIFLNPATGADMGSVSIPQGARMSPVAWGNRILIADQRGTLLFIDPETMAVARSVETASTQPIALAPTLAPSGIAVFSGRRGDVSAVDLEEGLVLWNRTLSETEVVPVHSDVVVGSGTAFVYGGSRLYALSMNGGTDLFAPIDGVTAPPLISDQMIFLCRDNGILSVHDAANGELIVEIPLDESVTAAPVKMGDYIVLGAERSAIVVDPRSLIP